MCIMKLSPMNKIWQRGPTALLLSCATLWAAQCIVSAATLSNRYSFSDVDDGAGNIGKPIVDSVGGPPMSGILPAGGTLTGSQLQLGAFAQQYVQLPAGIVSNYTAVTVDAWATFGQLPVNCFFFGFGDTNGTVGRNYIFCAPQGGRIAITGADPGYTAEQGCGGAGDFSLQTVHITAVFNPPLGYVALYTNGVFASANTGVTTPMSSVHDLYSWIGKSLYSVDPWPDISLDEFRIWNGALNALEIAGDNLSGQDTVSLNYGAVNGIGLQVTSPIAIGAAGLSSVTLSASGLTSPVVVGTPDIVIAYSSLNPNIATVNSTNGTVTGVASGTAQIVASYSGFSATQSVQVISLPTTMAHRYSFNDGTANDSIGTANGTFFNNSGQSSITNGQLNLAGIDKGDYVDLGSYVVSTTNIANNALTFETWFTLGPSQGAWTRIWDFGNLSGTIGASSGNSYWSFMPNTANNGGVGRTEISSGGNLDVDTANFLGKTNVHVAVVFNPNPSRQFFGMYVNGKLVNSAATGNKNLGSINNVYSWLGRSLWSGDSALTGSIDEFRIYNGELDRFQIAASFQSGPNTTNFNLGNFVSFNLDVGIQPIPLNSRRTAGAFMNFTQVTNVFVTGDPNLTWASDNTNVFTVSPAGIISATGVGSANLSATYKYIVGVTTNTYSGSIAVAVYRDQPSSLVHRYAFTNDATDAINPGGAWDGTTPNGATYSGGQVYFDKTVSQYVQLPAGILSNYTAVTIESWVSSDINNGQFSFFYGFGDTDAGGAGQRYLFGSLNRNYAAITDADPGYLNEQGVFAGPGLNGLTNLHWTAVYNPPAGYIAIYTNGVLAGMNSSVTIPLSSVTNFLNYIGRSLYNGDPYPILSVDEFRIYNGVLHADEIAAAQVLGPNQTLTTSAALSVKTSGNNVVLSWPLAAAGFTVQSRASLTAGAWAPVSAALPQIVGTQWQLSVPKSTTTQFFRLQR